MNNLDPQQRMRLLLEIPDDGEGAPKWAMPCLPALSLSIDLPKRGTMVWVMFEGGNADYPVWMGYLPT